MKLPSHSRLVAAAYLFGAALATTTWLAAANPIITDVCTADPAALVHEGTVYLYTGHDEQEPNVNGYKMHDWLVFSSSDMVNWTPHGPQLSIDDFEWAEANAWAAHTVEKNGTFYWYVTVWRGHGKGFAVGVATADNPIGPFTDAIGAPLITSDMTPDPINPEGNKVTWDDIDPAVYIDDDGQAYIFWGNTNLYWAKLKPNMLELDGEIHQIDLPRFVEAPWVHKRGDTYYLSYAWGFPERTAYATSKSIAGPWKYGGVINEIAGNSNTNHQSIIHFKGRDYFIYHNGGLLTGGSFRRSFCIDYLYYNEDGSIKPIVPTMAGVKSADATDNTVAGKPIETDMFTADPAPLVHDDTLYIFTGHDIQEPGQVGFKMHDWYAFSTTDMVNYEKHGPLLSIDDFDWAVADAFASHVTERDGKFYWYVSARHKDIRTTEGMAIGVAVADHPLGPYRDAIGDALVTDDTPNSVTLNIDPAVYLDDDGQAYLFWGSWDEARWVKLKDNMVELDGPVHTLDAKNFFEAPWVHKHDGTYYLSYAGSGYPSKTEYATSGSVAGPWTYGGVINDLMPKSETNHQGIVEFKGKWYFVYHNSALPTGGVFRRSVAVDELHHAPDGKLLKVKRTLTGPPAVE
jgi:beta-xylosidase